MAENYNRLTDAEISDRIIRMSFDDRENDVRAVAIRAVNDFNELAATKLAEQQFADAVVTITGKLRVAMPAVPDDLAALTRAQLITLANTLALASWDYQQRVAHVEQNRRYWATMVDAATPVAPTTTTYLSMLLRMMNYVRAERGLSAIV